MARSTQDYVRALEDSKNILNPLLHLLVQKKPVETVELDNAIAATLRKGLDATHAQLITFVQMEAREAGIRLKYIHLSPRLHLKDEALRKKVEAEAQAYLDKPLPALEGAGTQVLASGESLLASGSRVPNSHFAKLLENLGFSIQSLIVVPVKVGNRCIGWIEAINRFPEDRRVAMFSEEDLCLLENLAVCVGKAIAHSRDSNVAVPERERAGYLARLSKCELAGELTPDQQLLVAIGPEPLKRYGVLPLAKLENDAIRAAVSNPLDFHNLTDFEVQTGLKIREKVVATETVIRDALQRIFPGSSRIAKVAERITREYDGPELVTEAALASESDETSALIVNLANRIIEDAYQLGASDIHIEPYEEKLIVRYRIDGICRMKLALPKAAHPSLVARLKIMSDLNIAEHRLPQDGKIVFKKFSTEFDLDLRISVAPMNYGESIVLRILDKTKSNLPLDRLGFSAHNLDLYRKMIRVPYGMILHCGPTGSGKSMTLYAALNEINSPESKILTAEDPIEYTLQGINQLQVKREIGLTFASTLRCFLRQDPDIILVGEIRDTETAEIAVEAALTGHLLFSTLHTNDACSTITRLTEIGIEPYLISNALTGICAQRLIRKLCSCKRVERQSPEELKLLASAGQKPRDGIFRPGGCDLCDKSGYKGRTGIHELMNITDELRAMIVRRVPADALKAQARREGMRTLFEDAMEKVCLGASSLAEALLTARPDENDISHDVPVMMG
jgi:type II secretory ATPase GspE/PulE/Tfp pilus assembly ATPase PilB-like protein